MLSTRDNRCLFSIDVEDWFHILDIKDGPPLESWDARPSHVSNNFKRLLDLLDEQNVKATCFFLGWIARKYPELVKLATDRGHEIASHGFAHLLAYEVGRQKFFDDACQSKKELEDISGGEVIGYRAAGFSATDDTEWLFETLIEAGYKYDSSVFPARRGHGGMRTDQLHPHRIMTPSGSIYEFPQSVVPFGRLRLSFFGGGYLRLYPYRLIRSMAKKVLKDNRPVLFYIHPREIEPNHPRLKMPLWRRFKSYHNLRSTEGKIKSILTDFEFSTFALIFDYLAHRDENE